MKHQFMRHNFLATINILRKLGCERIYKENASGGRWDRPELHEALEHLRRGDVLICWKLDRLSRSLSDLLRILQKVDQAGAKFKSLTDELDTTTPMGRMRARANGRVGGGRYKLSASQQAGAIKMIRVGEKSQAEMPSCSMSIGARFHG
jgi:DNA invertase Pin-like site-specific DNA recombinase